MKKMISAICLLVSMQAGAQQSDPGKTDAQFFMSILLDKITTVGSLKACPAKNDPTQYFYLPNKVRIATDDATGEPKFSFIKYVTNKRSGAEETEIKEGEGGGWVHALIGLKVNADEITAAQSELSRKVPGAKLVGPVIYRSGTVSLVTKSAATNEKLKVLGIKDAPVLDDDFLAVGFPLNAEDASILWETMKGPNPDVSLNFNMTLAGLNAPIGAKMEVNWDVLNAHRLMNLSVDIPVVKAEISDMVTELRQNGTIKITTVGNKPLDTALVRRIENYVIDLCFSKSDTSLQRSKKNYVIGADGGKSRRDLERDRADLADKTERDGLTQDIASAGTERTAAGAAAAEARKKLATDEAAVAKTEQDILDAKFTQAEGKYKAAKEIRMDIEKKIETAKGAGNDSLGSGTEKDSLQTELSKAASEEEKAEQEKDASEKTRDDYRKNTQAKLLATSGNEAEKAETKVGKAEDKVDDLVEARRKIGGISLADFSIEAVYHRAKIRRSGQFVVDLNHYDPVTISEPFGGNIGRIKCRNCLLEVNTASQLYTQRELVAFLDGGALADFDKYINYVTVKMRKQHMAGDLTYDEVRIDRKNFNAKGNAFKMMYGWGNGDNDRRAWLDYDYQTTWNFFGGHTETHDWKSSNENVIGISPPFNRSEIRLIADKEQLKAASVRAVFVKIYYRLGDKEYVKKASLNPATDILQQQVEIISPKDALNYDYETEWVLTDNSTVRSRRTTATSDLLFVDVLPKSN